MISAGGNDGGVKHCAEIISPGWNDCVWPIATKCSTGASSLITVGKRKY